MAIVTLTTDFGTADHYVAAMKGVILSAAPKALIVDVTHEAPRGGILQAAFTLAQLPAAFPAGTVHLAVIDPTVGTDRAILAAASAGQFFIAPDNGLLSLVHSRWGLSELRQVEPPPAGRVSRTFHGRDIMAPAAARLATRPRLADLGPTTDRMELLDGLAPTESPAKDRLDGQVIHVDHFGNCTTNIPEPSVRRYVERSAGLRVWAGETPVGPPVKTYADAPPGEPLALIGSAGLLEVAVNLGSAADRLGLSVGSPVSLRYE